MDNGFPGSWEYFLKNNFCTNFKDDQLQVNYMIYIMFLNGILYIFT